MLPDDDDFNKSSYSRSVTYHNIAGNLFGSKAGREGTINSDFNSSGVLSVTLNVTEIANKLRDNHKESSFCDYPDDGLSVDSP